ncbi:prolyl oligopeptidase-like protein [Tricladium varicosporioides]|nr:prolyl oligopeptidase-like protein [Hymenoscyphus varicosporioides]
MFFPSQPKIARLSILLAASTVSLASQQVTTSYGTVEGVISDVNSAVAVYKGIPFATPPISDLRWKAPTSPSNWTGILNATSFGPDCAQSYSALGVFSSGSEDISEDCLYMNIWTPANATSASNLPVYVWIYGGRFEGGAGSVPTYDGSHLASKDIVVINFNYRMGPFGFLAHPELDAESPHNSSGNYGLLDQIQALTFVQEEIAAFGGNPDHITVGGQSAGSASALDMMYSPLSSDKIVATIAESGARGVHDPETYGLATAHRSKAAAEASGIAFLVEMNATTITELRNVSMADLLKYDSAMDSVLVGTVFENSSAISNPPLWRPVIDGYVLPYLYGESLRLNAHGNIPILTGDNKGETSDSTMTLAEFQEAFGEIMQGNLSTDFFNAYPADDAATAGNQSFNFWDDVNRVSTWDWAQAWYEGGATENVFLYYWTHAPPNQTAGAYHGSELWYVFGNLPTYYNYTWTTQDYALQTQMSEYWANFIKTGNPNGGNLTTFPAASNTTQVMWLGDSTGASYLTQNTSQFTVIQEFFSQQVEF